MYNHKWWEKWEKDEVATKKSILEENKDIVIAFVVPRPPGPPVPDVCEKLLNH
jgi:hypothetical protein